MERKTLARVPLSVCAYRGSMTDLERMNAFSTTSFPLYILRISSSLNMVFVKSTEEPIRKMTTFKGYERENGRGKDVVEKAFMRSKSVMEPLYAHTERGTRARVFLSILGYAI